MKGGDRLIWDVSLESFRHISQPENLDMLVSKNVIWNQHDEPVMTTYTSLVARTGVEVDPAVVDSLDHVMMKVDALGDPGKTVQRTVADHGRPDPLAPPGAGRATSSDSLTVGQGDMPQAFPLTRGELADHAGRAERRNHHT